ncbi:unnamed protein product [Rhizopus stolonifer]
MEKRWIESKTLFTKQQETIENIKNTLKREITLLVEEYDLTEQDMHYLNEFIQDKVNLFRYLRKNNNNVDTCLSLLLDTIKWRIRHDVDRIDPSHFQHQKKLVYFHKTDKLNRPIVIIHLSELSLDDTDPTEQLTPLIIFVLESIRKLIYKMFRGDDPVFETVLLVDFKDASSLPVDRNLFKSLLSLLRKYPGMIGTVQLVHFSWVYQGLWQMCKLILSEEAKSKVNFPKEQELKDLIEPENLLKEFGGQDRLEWSENDDLFGCYDDKLSRRNSNSSIYYDARTTLSRSASFTALTPISLKKTLSMQKLTVGIQDLFTTNAGETLRDEESGWIKLAQRTIKKIKGHRRTFYWILACVLFRNGIQQVFQQVLLLIISRQWRRLLNK